MDAKKRRKRIFCIQTENENTIFSFTKWTQQFNFMKVEHHQPFLQAKWKASRGKGIHKKLFPWLASNLADKRLHLMQKFIPLCITQYLEFSMMHSWISTSIRFHHFKTCFPLNRKKEKKPVWRTSDGCPSYCQQLPIIRTSFWPQPQKEHRPELMKYFNNYIILLFIASLFETDCQNNCAHQIKAGLLKAQPCIVKFLEWLPN